MVRPNSVTFRFAHSRGPIRSFVGPKMAFLRLNCDLVALSGFE